MSPEVVMASHAGRFDEALVIDWSAAATKSTGADSCWIAHGGLDARVPITVTNHATRVETMAEIDRRLDRALNRGRRVLVAIDVSFGFAAGAAKTLGLRGRPAWSALWATLEARLHDDDQNRNDRFEVADAMNAACGTRVFWGRPVASSFSHLVHLPIRNVDVEGLAPNPLPKFRACEELAGPGVISNWMLVGQGSVGGQILTCLPYLERLRRRLGDQVAVWPFEGPGDPGAPVVLAETWHGLFDWRSQPGAVRDAQQVRGTLITLRNAGSEGRRTLLDPPSMRALSQTRRRQILAEEGWTLGVL
jgi:hypothetical protein